MKLRIAYPIANVASNAQSASGAAFEQRYKDVSLAEWKEKERQRFAHYVACMMPDVTKTRVLLLDGHELLATKALQSKGVLLENIHVPNWEAATIASKHRKRDLPCLYGASLSDFIHSCNLTFDAVWFDTCCQCTNAQLADIKYMFRANLFSRDKNTLFFATYCGKRELEHNAILLRYESQGIKRTDALRLLISEYAIHGKYTTTTPRVMALDMCNHGMISVAAIVKTDPDPTTAMSIKRMEMPAHKELDCTGLYPCAETSMLPVRILSMRGKRARCEPIYIDTPCVTDREESEPYEKDIITVPLKRLKEARFAGWDQDPPRGTMIEVAWRETPGSPISWWKARVIRCTSERVKVVFVFQPKIQWVKKDCCRLYEN